MGQFALTREVPVLGLLLSGLLLGCGSDSFEGPTPPNLLVILADDLGWDDVGYHGGQALTPRIDELRKESQEFTRFYAYPTCSPSRAALLTGRTPMELGMVRGPIHPWALRRLPAEVPTLANILSDQGYDCALVGKWHLGLQQQDAWPNERGFDHFYGLLGGAASYFDRRRRGGLDWQRNGKSVVEKGYTTDLLADEAIALIEKQAADEPLFLLLSMTAPHTPLGAPKALARKLEHIENPERRKYLSVVAGLDDAVGRVIQALDNSEIGDNTLVVFVSDNGAEPKYGGSNTPFRGGKASTFEGGLRVPLMIRWPDNVAPNSSSHQAAWMPDLFATLAEVAGVQTPNDTKGRSLLLPSRSPRPRPFYFSHQSGDASWLALIEGEFKAVWHIDWAAGAESFELFQIQSDPQEEHDLASTKPEIAKGFKQSMSDWAEGSGLLEAPVGNPQPPNWTPPSDWAKSAR